MSLLTTPEGTLSYDDTGGDGRLLVAAPGIGDLRQVYRHLTPRLVRSGLRVATVDLRGAGESSVQWADTSDAATARDITTLIDHLDAGPAVVVGNSMSAASAVIAATDRPDAVTALVLIGPFAREVPVPVWKRWLFKIALARPWGRSIWIATYRNKTYPSAPPADHAEHVGRIAANLAEPGRFATFRRVAFNSHAEAGSRLGKVEVPVLVVMGTKDPDFPDPEGEARYIADRTGGSLLLVPGAGHYPQAEYPDVVAEGIVAFLAEHRVS